MLELIEKAEGDGEVADTVTLPYELRQKSCLPTRRAHRRRARPRGSRACAVEPITSPTPSATRPTDHPPRESIQAARQHWRCTAMRSVNDSSLSGLSAQHANGHADEHALRPGCGL